MAPRRDLPERPVTALGVVSPLPIQVQAPNFEGSLATLFACVRERRLDLMDVPLYPICEAYLLYLANAEPGDLDNAAAALAALAYLLERKAWGLLPVAEPEPEAEEPLALIEPTAYEYAAVVEALRVYREEREQLFFRAPGAGVEPADLPLDLGRVTSPDLARALERLLRRASPPPVPAAPSRRSLAEEMRRLLVRLGEGEGSLEALVPTPFTRQDAVVAFLALLELVRLGQASIRMGGDEVLFARSAR